MTGPRDRANRQGDASRGRVACVGMPFGVPGVVHDPVRFAGIAGQLPVVPKNSIRGSRRGEEGSWRGNRVVGGEGGGL